jgi:murein DD-endopeptidase MepM/ murein hydrolase activator NlpD
MEIHVLPHEGRWHRWRIRILERSWRLARFGAGVVAVLVLFSWGYLLSGESRKGLVAQREAALEIGRHLKERQDGLKAELLRLREKARELGSRIGRVERVYDLSPSLELGELHSPRREVREVTEVEAALEELSTELSRLRRRLDRVAAWEKEHAVEVSGLPIRPPLWRTPWVLVGAFGPYRSPFTGERVFQTGVRLAAPRGTPVRAVAKGTVSFAGVPSPNRGEFWQLGKLVVIRHGGAYVSLYGHLGSLYVRSGMQVEAGDVIAEVSDSGWTFGPQIYFELRQARGGRFVPVDPFVYWIGVPLPEGWSLRPLPETWPELPREWIE